MLPPNPPPSERARATEGEGLSLSEIAHRLTTPALSGLVVTKDRVGAIAMDLGLPVGFSERSQMLMNMFRAAAELDCLPALLAALKSEADRWETRYAAWATEYPASAPIWKKWRARLAATRALLDEMEAALTGPTMAPDV
jgi:hypothetical protein